MSRQKAHLSRSLTLQPRAHATNINTVYISLYKLGLDESWRQSVTWSVAVLWELGGMPFHQLTNLPLSSVEAGTRHVPRNQFSHQIGTVETLLGPRYLVKPNSQREPAQRHVVKTCCNIISNNWPYDYRLQKSCWATQWHKLEMRLSIRCFLQETMAGRNKGICPAGICCVRLGLVKWTRSWTYWQSTQSACTRNWM